MKRKDQWERTVSNLVKAELKRRGFNYADLVARLREIGVETTESSVVNKLSRGRFSAVFLAQCLAAIGSDRLRLD